MTGKTAVETPVVDNKIEDPVKSDKEIIAEEEKVDEPEKEVEAEKKDEEKEEPKKKLKKSNQRNPLYTPRSGKRIKCICTSHPEPHRFLPSHPRS